MWPSTSDEVKKQARSPRRIAPSGHGRVALFCLLVGAGAGCQIILGIGDHDLSFDAGTERAVDARVVDASVDSFCKHEPPGHFFCADFDDNPPSKFGMNALEERGNGSVSIGGGDAAVSPPWSLEARAPAAGYGETVAARGEIDVPIAATSVRFEFDMYLCTPSFGSTGSIEFAKLEQASSRQSEIGIEVAFLKTRGVLALEIDQGVSPIDKSALTTVLPPTEAWTHVILDVSLDNANGHVRLFYNRATTPVVSAESIRTKSADLTKMGVKLGVYMSDVSTPCTSYFDNVIVDVTH